MKFAALLSGGKDSILGAILSIKGGNELVAIANLYPREDADEIDSYMYQTVGHRLINSVGEAIGVPLYKRKIRGEMILSTLDYSFKEGDEVEDLFELVKKIKFDIPDLAAISTGAVFSKYQASRVDNICERLNLKHLKFLWRMEPSKLLLSLKENNVEAIIVKTASSDLNPNEFLGVDVVQNIPKLDLIKSKISRIGEGGEYETITLNCPIFKKEIKVNFVKKGNLEDKICPTGYLKFTKFDLIKKNEKFTENNDFKIIEC